MNFDTLFHRKGLGSKKWDEAHLYTGVTAERSLPMWVADMDFQPPACVLDTAGRITEAGDFGYFCRMEEFYASVAWWQQTRHVWTIDPRWCLTTFGLGNAIAIALQTFSQPGDAVAFFTPVYHEFQMKTERNDRVARHLPLAKEGGKYVLDWDAYDALMTGAEKILIISSPHNPAGRVWTRDELKAIADFCVKHDLLLISDEIHNDLVHPGHTHIPMAVACPEILDRLIMMNSASKTFNLAGLRTGNVIIPDESLRKRFAHAIGALDMQPNLYGVRMTQAAYSPEGAAWVDALCAYLAGNAAVMAEGIAQIPGLSFMPMESTYLAWIDFAGTGMSVDEFTARVRDDAHIGTSPGAPFGTGGETCLRFNIGTQRSRVIEAVERLQAAFKDLQ
jgi:cystathionine beta-lyase